MTEKEYKIEIDPGFWNYWGQVYIQIYIMF